MSEPVDLVLERLDGVEQLSNGSFQALCPAHHDKKSSLSVSEGDDGRALLKCHAGCDTKDVLDRLALTEADLFVNPQRNGHRKPTATWQVRNVKGEVQALHVRFDGPDGKKILWKLPGGTFKEGLKGRKLETLPLYGSERVGDWPDDVPIIVTEGEKAADALLASHVPALGTVTGAGKTPGTEALEVLRGRSVILWSDADEPGRGHMRKVADALQGIAAEVRVFEWEDAPKEGADAANHPAVLSRSRQGVGELYDDMAKTPVWEASVPFTHSQTPMEVGVNERKPLVVKSFRELPTFTGPRPYVVRGIMPARFPTTIYGDGGSAKSIIALSVAQGIARGADNWCGHRIERGRVSLFLDFELDEEEQSRRALQIARGNGLDDSPEDIYYLCGAGHRTADVFAEALHACEEHGIELVVVDSVGLALEGDPSDPKAVISFFHELDKFRVRGITVLLVDHQSKSVAGESYQHKTAYGSVYKGNLSRSRIQVETKERAEGTLRVILHHNKANFGGLVDPFAVKLGFSEEKITLERDELDETELRKERTLNAADRILLALLDGQATAEELAQKAEPMALGTARNELTKLERDGYVEHKGDYRDRSRVFGLTDKGETHALSFTHSHSSRGSGVNERKKEDTGDDGSFPFFGELDEARS